MSRDILPPRLPNTFRDSNDSSNAASRQTLVLRSSPSLEEMDTDSNYHGSIVEPVESNDSLASFAPPLYDRHVNNIPMNKSIVRSTMNNNDDDVADRTSSQNQNAHRFNGHFPSNDDVRLEAAGYASSQPANLDADAAYALRLQQEEYSRDTMIPFQNPYLPGDGEVNGETASRSVFFHPGYQLADNDGQLARFLLRQETHQNQQYCPPFAHAPTSSRTLEANGPEVIPIPSLLATDQRHMRYNEDDSEDDISHLHDRNALFQIFGHHARSMRGGFPQFLQAYHGRSRRRGGNLQETADDFGPEDYERLLQLDETVNKVKLTKEQMNSIPMERFSRPSNKSDEENQCGICLERFEENQALRRYPCSHLYHRECSDRWLQENNACPICRVPPVIVQERSNSRHRRAIHHGGRSTNTQRNSNNRNHNPRSHPTSRGATNHRQS